MKRIIRKIINWAYGENLTFHLYMLQKRQDNISIMFYDAILKKCLDAGIEPGDIIHCEEVGLWPDTPDADKKGD